MTRKHDSRESEGFILSKEFGLIGRKDAEAAASLLLAYVGENPERDGLKETPARMVRALVEMTEGYRQKPEEILSKTFDEHCDEIIVVRDIDFVSLCEHHCLIFTGKAHVGYLPGKVVGLSKLARLVDCFAKRLQIQERLTQEIAKAIHLHLNARGVGVIIEAHHSCMGCRGVMKPSAMMVTSSMLGLFRDEPETRAEFLSLVRG